MGRGTAVPRRRAARARYRDSGQRTGSGGAAESTDSRESGVGEDRSGVGAWIRTDALPMTDSGVHLNSDFLQTFETRQPTRLRNGARSRWAGPFGDCDAKSKKYRHRTTGRHMQKPVFTGGFRSPNSGNFSPSGEMQWSPKDPDVAHVANGWRAVTDLRIRPDRNVR